MEELRKKNAVEADKEIVFSKAIKAGKRIYYLDVKKNRKEEMFLTITESKKVVSGESDDLQVCYEKHKIFLYKEDFDKFIQGLNEAVGFIAQKQGTSDTKAGSAGVEDSEKGEAIHEEIKIDIDF